MSQYQYCPYLISSSFPPPIQKVVFQQLIIHSFGQILFCACIVLGWIHLRTLRLRLEVLNLVENFGVFPSRSKRIAYLNSYHLVSLMLSYRKDFLIRRFLIKVMSFIIEPIDFNSEHSDSRWIGQDLN